MTNINRVTTYQHLIFMLCLVIRGTVVLGMSQWERQIPSRDRNIATMGLSKVSKMYWASVHDLMAYWPKIITTVHCLCVSCVSQVYSTLVADAVLTFATAARSMYDDPSNDYVDVRAGEVQCETENYWEHGQRLLQHILNVTNHKSMYFHNLQLACISCYSSQCQL